MHSTEISEGVPRGAGFQTLHNFASANGGKIRICSGDVLYSFYNNRPHYQKLNIPFVGTMFEMEIFADNNHKYVLRTEVTG